MSVRFVFCSFFLGIALLVSLSCREKTVKETEYHLLQEFLNTKETLVSTERIGNLLFDVQSETDTMGRAFKITKNLFLTNHHVINVQGKYIQLIKQENRGMLKSLKGEFEVIHQDKKRDLALLRLKKIQPDDEVLIHLHRSVPKEKEDVSEFIRLNGKSVKHSGYRLAFGGRDLYDKDNFVPNLGVFLLPPNSALFEKKGFVLPFREKKIRELTKKLPSDPKNEIITSIAVYQGESGSPVFWEEKKGAYHLIGVTTKTLSMGEILSTPGDPMGYMAYDRTVSFVVHRNAIFEFIQEYLKKMKKEIETGNS